MGIMFPSIMFLPMIIMFLLMIIMFLPMMAQAVIMGPVERMVPVGAKVARMASRRGPQLSLLSTSSMNKKMVGTTTVATLPRSVTASSAKMLMTIAVSQMFLMYRTFFPIPAISS